MNKIGLPAWEWGWIYSRVQCLVVSLDSRERDESLCVVYDGWSHGHGL